MMRQLLLILTVSAFILPASAAQTPTPATQRNTTGEALYFKFGCYACHDYSGQNGPGARLVPMRMSAPQFLSYVRNAARMPPYTTKVVTDAQMSDIYAYILTLKASPAARDIPLLNQLLKD